MSNQIHNPEHHNIQDYAKYININNVIIKYLNNMGSWLNRRA